MLGGSSGTLTSLAMSGVLVGDGEFSKVRSNHVEFDFNRHVVLTIVDTNDGTDHSWDDDAISQSSSDHLWLLTGWDVELGLLESLQKLQVWTLESLGSKTISDFNLRNTTARVLPGPFSSVSIYKETQCSVLDKDLGWEEQFGSRGSFERLNAKMGAYLFSLLLILERNIAQTSS